MYNLPRQSLKTDVYKIISKQKSKRDLELFEITRKQRLSIDLVAQEIAKEGMPKRFIRKKLPGKIGYGIFLHPKAAPISRGEVIAPYAGEVSLIAQNAMDNGDYAFDPVTDITLSKEEQALYDPKNRYHPRRLYALKLDALRRGNFTRFINHSNRPNITAYLVSSKSNPLEIVYFAKRKIAPGEQLLVSYEDGENTYWKPLGIKPFAMTSKTFQIDKHLQLVKKQ